MAKNTLSNAFRKIDVDQFNEDNFKDDEVTNETSFGRVSESEIANLLNKGNSAEALKVLLASAPIGSKNQADKVLNLSNQIKSHKNSTFGPFSGRGVFFSQTSADVSQNQSDRIYRETVRQRPKRFTYEVHLSRI